MKHGVVQRIVCGGIADFGFVNDQVLIEEQPDFADLIPMVMDSDAFQVNVFALVYPVVDQQRDTQMIMRCPDFRDKRVLDIGRLDIPFGIGKPGETAVHP